MKSFSPFDPDYLSNPYEYYKHLRLEDPYCYIEKYDCFFLSRFEDVYEAARDTAMVHDRGTMSDELLLGQPVATHQLSRMKGDEHKSLRAHIRSFFTPRAVALLEDDMRSFVRNRVTQLREKGRFDAYSDFSQLLSSRTAFQVLGFPEEDASEVAVIVNKTNERSSDGGVILDSAEDAKKDLYTYVQDILSSGFDFEAESLTSRFKSFEYNGIRMTEEELVANCYTMIVGGTETLPKVICGVLSELFDNAGQRELVQNDHALSADAFWEGLRLFMPTLMLGATADRDTSIRGIQEIKAGQKVMFLWASANRDETVFDNPECYDMERRAERLVSFNPGRHNCLGMHLAQLEGKVLLEEFFGQIGDYSIDREQQEILATDMFRGFVKLPIIL